MKGKVTIMADSYMNELNYAKSLYENGDYSECLQYIIQQLSNEIEAKTNEKQEVEHKFVLDFSAVSIDALVELFKSTVDKRNYEETFSTVTNTFSHAFVTVGATCNADEAIEFLKDSFYKYGKAIQDVIAEILSSLITTPNVQDTAYIASVLYQHLLSMFSIRAAFFSTVAFTSLEEEERKEKLEFLEDIEFIDKALINEQKKETALSLYEIFKEDDSPDAKYFALSTANILIQDVIAECSKEEIEKMTLIDKRASILYLCINECSDVITKKGKSELTEELNKLTTQVKKDNPKFVFSYEKIVVEKIKQSISVLKETTIPNLENEINVEIPKKISQYKKACIIAAVVCVLLMYVTKSLLFSILLSDKYLGIGTFLFYLSVWEICRRRFAAKNSYANSKMLSKKATELESKKATLKEYEEYIKNIEGKVNQ